VKVWKPEVEEWQEWFDRGNELLELGRFEEAIASCDRAIKIKPDYDEAWHDRGISLGNLGRYEEAIDSYDRAIVIKPDNDKYWACLGVALSKLGRYEKAVSCYERAIEINPERYAVWMIRGVELDKLARYEEAIFSFEKAIEIESNYDMVWYCRGVALVELARYEEAVFSFEQAIEIKPDKAETWYNRGVALGKSARYKEAIASYDRAIKIELDIYKAWSNRGSCIGNLHGFQAEINAYREAFTYIHPETHPEGWGDLQHITGRTHYNEGNNQLFNYRKNSQPYYERALNSYHNALETLTREQFPKLRLETLIDTAKAYLAQRNTLAAHQCKIEAVDILRDLLNNEPTFAGKKRLQIEYISLSQLDVDLFVASGDNIRALEAAELNKNNRLTWLLSALAEPTISPESTRMQQLLATTSPTEVTGILYWHLSPDNLTTFILTPADSLPLVSESDRRAQAQELAKWIKEWDTQYRDYGSKKLAATPNRPHLLTPVPNPGSRGIDLLLPSPKIGRGAGGEGKTFEKEDLPWRKNLPDNLARLRQILEIDRICARLPANLTRLILIPHSDLHRFPLHTLFLNSANLPNLQGCTYLPSIQIGLNLQHRSTPTRSYTPLLSVEDPETHQAEMPFARIESAIVRYLFQPQTHIDSASASLAAVENALRQPHASFHFTGHAAYNSRSPEASALALTDEPLTAKRISQLDLSSYNLITLAACETAITGREKIDTEYIGLTSAFLQAGAANILSTLWQVDEIANAWFTIYFYQQLLAGKSPAVALNVTQRWLQTVTWQALVDWLTQFAAIETIEDYIKDILEEEGKIELDRSTKYSHPYYWAAFTLTGQG
jgi:CHAT domain-containing protein/Flp pilus assembly protein TadD